MLSQYTLEGKDLGDIVHAPPKWITKTEQSIFIQMLLELANLYEYFDPLSNCATQCAKYRCSKNPNHSKKARYNFCGKRGVCPRCSINYAFKRSEIMYQWIKQNLADKLNFDLKMNHIVLTLPQDLHSNISSKLFAKMISKFVEKMGIEAWGYSIQEMHSADPLSGRFVHVHILALSMKKGSKGLVRSTYYFDTEQMRATWKDVIETHAGLKLEGSVNVHTEYSSILHDKERTLNTLAYLYRYPIADLFELIVRKDPAYYLDILQFNDDTISSKIRSMIYSKPRLVWCGLVTSSKRKELMSLLPTNSSPCKDMPTIRRNLTIRSKTCLDCGAWLESRPYEVVCESDSIPQGSGSSVLDLQSFLNSRIASDVSSFHSLRNAVTK